MTNLPALPAAAAAVALGWAGYVVEDVELFGHCVAVVAAVDKLAHRVRCAHGWAPVTDRMAVALWEWPEAAAPPPVVRLTGVLARDTHWKPALRTAGGFVGFASTAILLDQAPDEHCLITAQLHGVAVLRSAVARSPVVLVQPGRVGPAPTARPSALSRWVEELVYQRLLDEERITRDNPAGG